MGKLLIFSCEEEEGKGKGKGKKEKFIYKVYVSPEIEGGGKGKGGCKGGDGVLAEVPVPTKRGGSTMKSMYEGTLYSTAVSFMNKVVVIGGMDSKFKPTTEVAAYTLSPKPRRFLLPNLLSPKASPIVIPVSSLIYVFSQLIFEIDSTRLDASPRCEVFVHGDGHGDGHCHGVWKEIKLPLTFPPPRTPVSFYFGTSQSTSSYLIDAYAPCCFSDGVYLSIKNVCSYYVQFFKESSSSIWTISPNQMRFYGEAKRLGLTDKYVAFSRNPEKASAFCIYKLVHSTLDCDVFSFDELSVFSMPSTYRRPFINCFSNKLLLQPLSHDTICLINCRVASSDGYPIDLTEGFPHFIVTEVFKLPMDDEEATTLTKKRKRKKKTAKINDVKLLGYTRYPDMPLPHNWCFFDSAPTSV